jgi:hypothetical protein
MANEDQPGDTAGEEQDGPDDAQVFERTANKPIAVSAESRQHWNDKNPRKFTPDAALKIIQYIAAGCFIETAAGAAGVTKKSLYNWMALGENPKDPRSTPELRAWKKLLDEAEALAEARAVQGIQAAGAGGTWQAYAWFLERKHANRWRAKSSVIPENPDGTPYVGAAVQPKSSEEMIRQVQAMQAALAATAPGKDAPGAPEPV